MLGIDLGILGVAVLNVAVLNVAVLIGNPLFCIFLDYLLVDTFS